MLHGVLKVRLTEPVWTALLPELHVPTMTVALCMLSYTMGVLPCANEVPTSDASTTVRREGSIMLEKGQRLLEEM